MIANHHAPASDVSMQTERASTMRLNIRGTDEPGASGAC
jgi:hypothetical protein